MFCAQAATPWMRRWPACSCRSWRSRPSPDPGAGGFMLVHTPAGWQPSARLLRRRAGTGPRRRGAGAARTDRRPLLEGRDTALQRGPVVVRRLRHHAGSGRGARAFRHRHPGRPVRRAARAAREGVEVVPMQAFLFTILEPILRATPESDALYAPEGRLLARGRDDPAARAGRPPRAPGRSGTGLPVPRRRGGGLQRLGARARRALTTNDLTAYEVIERPRPACAITAARC